MKLTLRSTDLFIDVNGVPMRQWRGETESGTSVTALIPLIIARFADDAPKLERELPTVPTPAAVAPFASRKVIKGSGKR